MALRTPPSWLQNGSHPAENDRLTTQALYNTTGIIGSSSMAVTANSPAGMSVRVATGWAAIVGTTQSNMGTYVAFNDATTVLTVTAADPTNARIDRVVATINDAYYTGSTNNVVFQVVAGTPAASPSAPATPANSISLATIAVAAGATQINTGNITDTRVAVTTNLPVGKTVQVSQTTATPNFSTTSNSFVDVSGMSASITPSTSTSKILVTFTFPLLAEAPPSPVSVAAVNLVRGSSTVLFNDFAMYYAGSTYTGNLAINVPCSISYLDSPATTSATTYKLQLRKGSNTTQAVVSGPATMILQEVLA